MSAVSFPTVARKALVTLQRLRNGLYPEAGTTTHLQEEANRIVALRGKQWTFAAPLATLHAAAGSFLQRWRAFIHTSTHCRYIYVRALSMPSNNAGRPVTTVTFTVSGDVTPSATCDFSYGAETASDALNTVSPGQMRPTFAGAFVDLLPDTDYEVNVYDADNARTASVCLFETALERDTANGYVVNGVVGGQDILQPHRADIMPMLRDAWLRNARPLITWSSDIDASSPTRTSATIANLIDGVTGSPTAATAGFTLNLTNQSTLRRAADGIPVIMRAYGKCAGGGSGHVYLTDSAGTDLIDTEIDTTTEAWYSSGAFNLPATDGKYDLRFGGDGVNLLTVRAVSLYCIE